MGFFCYVESEMLLENKSVTGRGERKNMARNKVILVGGDHHNGLGLVRIFGRNEIFPYGIIVQEGEKSSFVAKSKYWSKVWVVKSESEILTLLKNEFQNEKEKPVVIPYSDGAASLVDTNLNELQKKYILPSMGNQQGEVYRLMDKETQTDFARQIGFDMLPTQIYSMDKIPELSPFDLPIILKPVRSTEGLKQDIRVCTTTEEYQKALTDFRQKLYQRVLVQTYLQNKKEYLIVGAIGRTSGNINFTTFENIREWPEGKGTGSYSKISEEKNVLEYSEKLLRTLQTKGFCGLIDIELLRDENQVIYINEINWRNSGRNFVDLYTRKDLPYLWYLDMIGNHIDFNKKDVMEKGYVMTEATDLRHVVYSDLSLMQWLKDWGRTNSFALWYWPDLKPTIAQYIYLFKELLHRRNT